jgi:hypothetical protein
MLKMFAKGQREDGKPVRLVVLGLSHKNLDELRKERPIKFNGSTVGLEDDIEILIFSGQTEQTIQRDFAQLIGPDTVVHIDPRLRDYQYA